MKTTIQGTPRQYDEAELKQRQEGFHRVYEQTDQCCELVKADIPHLFLAHVIERSHQGYELHTRYPAAMEPLNYSCRMLKPKPLQQKDLADIDEEVRSDYIAELKEEHQRYRDLLTQQLIEADAAKESKKLELARIKRLAEIEKEVDGCFGDLVIP